MNFLLQGVPWEQEENGYKAYRVGMWLSFVTKFGLRVMWDGGTRVQVNSTAAFMCNYGYSLHLIKEILPSLSTSDNSSPQLKTPFVWSLWFIQWPIC